ncbi:MAG: Asp-tRNA(Asn)/Glu-tRNA(Gln) amidotransferase GatCAB subunit B, partial [Bdellovibrionales bacterium]|nr:Asp-tRNA(Asn)/Glu-tRNA(Gln) amidotransferase GatCAB subunit B [Bdellovibrionales bacterium]
EDIKGSLPELPSQKKDRYQKELGLSEQDAQTLSGDRNTATYYEQCLSTYGNSPKHAKAISNLMSSEVLRISNEQNQSVEKLLITPEKLVEILGLMDNGTISGKIAKELVDEVAQSGQSPQDLVEKKGLAQISNPDQLQDIVDELIKSNPQQVEAYRAGKDKLFGFFVGQAMKASKGKANPQLLNELLKKALG